MFAERIASNTCSEATSAIIISFRFLFFDERKLVFDANKFVVTEMIKEKNVQIFIEVISFAFTGGKDVSKYETLILLFS